MKDNIDEFIRLLKLAKDAGYEIDGLAITPVHCCLCGYMLHDREEYCRISANELSIYSGRRFFEPDFSEYESELQSYDTYYDVCMNCWESPGTDPKDFMRDAMRDFKKRLGLNG